MGKKLKIRDLTLRDGQQSLFETRMTQEQIDRVLPLFREAGFYAMEVWGGAVPEAAMRYLDENPWERLTKIRDGIGDASKLAAVSRGRNLFGFNPYPDDIIDGFNRNVVRSGISIMRVFDALNDSRNIIQSIEAVKKNNAIADCAVCYTVDPFFSRFKKLKAFLQAKPLHNNVFTDEYYLDKAKEYQATGADMITIKDIAGLIPPHRAGRLVKLLKQNLDIPLDFHTHCTAGYGLASTLMAIVNGADVVDTCITPFAGGNAGVPFEIIQLFCNRMNIDTGVNLEAVVKINPILREIREELAEFDRYEHFPKEFNILTDKLPRDIDELFELAIAYAKADKEEDLLVTCHRIGSYFGFPEADEKLKEAEVPGSMYVSMKAQLQQMKLEHLMPRALDLIPSIRMDAGCPPLVTPTSQIIGVQAVNAAVDEYKGKPKYSTKSIQFVNLVKGVYGKTPVAVDPEFRYSIAGVREETTYDARHHKRHENHVFHEYGGVKLAQNEQEELLLELFPVAAEGYLRHRIEQDYLAEIHRIEEEKRAAFEAEKRAYESLTPEQKEQRLLHGLYHYAWTTDSDETLGHS